MVLDHCVVLCQASIIDKFPNFCNLSLSSFFKRNILFASILISSSVPESRARLSITDVSADRSSDDGLHQGSTDTLQPRTDFGYVGPIDDLTMGHRDLAM